MHSITTLLTWNKSNHEKKLISQSGWVYNFIKKTLQHKCFPANFAIFLRTPFFKTRLVDCLFRVLNMPLSTIATFTSWKMLWCRCTSGMQFFNFVFFTQSNIINRLVTGRKNWTYIRRSEDVQEVFWMFCVCSIFVQCLGGNIKVIYYLYHFYLHLRQIRKVISYTRKYSSNISIKVLQKLSKSF